MMTVFPRRPLLWMPSVGASVCLCSFVLGQAALGCRVSRVAQDVLQLRGQEYVELPAGLCPGYSDALLGKTQAFEYGGVICDRNEASYLLLQRLVGYTPEKKAIWKVVQIRTLARLNNDQQSISATCRHTRKRKQPVFAVTEDQTNQVLQAWAVDLERETIRPTRPHLVDCSDSL
ncbi:MAG: hypothetical protein AAF329_01650 [Cyanobacteria bacterium P01_A01_bin.17]